MYINISKLRYFSIDTIMICFYHYSVNMDLKNIYNRIYGSARTLSKYAKLLIATDKSNMQELNKNFPVSLQQEKDYAYLESFIK